MGSPMTLITSSILKLRKKKKAKTKMRMRRGRNVTPTSSGQPTDITATTTAITTATTATTGDITVMVIPKATGLTTCSGPNINGVLMDSIGPATLITLIITGAMAIMGITDGSDDWKH